MEGSPGTSSDEIGSGLTRADWAIASAVALVAFLARLRFALRTEAPLGVDGYYYAVQLRSLLSTGSLYYPASPLAFWLLLPFAAMQGPIDGLKTGASFLSSVAVLPATLLAFRATRNHAAAHLGGLLVAASLGSSFLAFEFVKQSIGSTLLLAALAAAAGLLDAATPKRLALTAALLAACALTHTTSAALSLCFVTPLVVVALGGDAPASTRKLAVLAGTALAAAGALALALASRMALLGELFRPLRTIHRGDEVILRLESGPALAAVVVLMVLSRWRPSWLPSPRRWVPIAVGPAVFTVLLNLPWLDTTDPFGPALRLLLMGFVPLAVLVPIAASGLARDRRVAVAAACVLLPAAILVPWASDREKAAPPGDLVPALEALRDRLPNDSVIITQEHHVAFQVKWLLDREATSVEPVRLDPSRTFRLLASSFPREAQKSFSLFESTLSPELPRPLHPLRERPQSVVLVPEPTWRAFVGTAPADIRSRVDPWPDERLRFRRKAPR